MSLARYIVLAAVLAGPAALAEGPGSMSLTFAEGEVTAQVIGVAPAAVVEGAILHEGDVLQTGAAGRAEVLLGTGSILRLGASSKVELHSAPDASSFRARLSFGNLWAKVHKLIAGQRFQIETQNAVAGVRGTEFRVAATEKGLNVVRVYEGSVEVKSDSFTHLVKPGSELRYSKAAKLGPRPFDVKGEKGPFMRWVREKGPQAGGGKQGADKKDHKPKLRERPQKDQRRH